MIFLSSMPLGIKSCKKGLSSTTVPSSPVIIYKKIQDIRTYVLYFWCGKRDLNPYGVNHTPLKRARLPVPPLPHICLLPYRLNV